MKICVHNTLLKIYLFNETYYNYDLIVFIEVKHDTTYIKYNSTLFIKDNYKGLLKIANNTLFS